VGQVLAVTSGPIDALSGVLLPRIIWSNEYSTTLVAILGTTISPYFFWQASQEAEMYTSTVAESHYGKHPARRSMPIIET
jgi:Mn2+/Fe2+ NRAMP family transporter